MSRESQGRADDAASGVRAHAGPANRLAREASPYLRQHAHNPVDWWPWGEAAFAEARRRDLPIFLSIGYSTCYWCHVMERESFESESIGRMLNDAFVCVKVDREERPDVDDVYMAAVQAFTGRGGWPMSVFLEPAGLRPFWAGTYLPPEDRPDLGAPGILRVTSALSAAWREQREEVLEQAANLAEAATERIVESFEPVRPTVEHVRRAVVDLLRLHDRRWGGFGPAPKFPQPVFVELLLAVRSAVDESTRSAIDAACRGTLDSMAMGGIFDQVGGGFHRYSVDERWTVPHFEKMLYDNAQLSLVYALAWNTYRDPFYRRTSLRTLEYVQRELTDDAGSLWSAQDAEVGAREGRNYLWTPEGVRAALSPELARVALEVYGLNNGPNFQDPHHPGEPATNVLRWADRPEALAERLGVSIDSLEAAVKEINSALLEARNKREQPSADDKVIAAWNSMMVHVMTCAGVLFDRPDLIGHASRAFESLWNRLVSKDGTLMRTWRDGQTGAPGVLEDYAWVARAALSLARQERNQTRRDELVRRARLMLDATGRLFGQARSEIVFDSPADRADLFVRPRSAYDGAMPSGISVLIHAWLDSAEVGGQPEAAERAIALLASISGAIDRSPTATANSTLALWRCLQHQDAVLRARVSNLPQSRARALNDSQDEEMPVEVLASVDRVEVAIGNPASFELRLVVKPDFHINAAVPLAGGGLGAGTPLVGLRVGVINGTGVRVYADYPEGEPAGERGELRVHRGTLDLTVAIEREAEWSGQPVLTLTYQACTETECLRPTTVELDIAIDRA